MPPSEYDHVFDLPSLEWQRDIIDDENFSVIHEITVRK